MINCSLSPKPQRMCATPCLLLLHRCLSASTPLWHTDSCTSFFLSNTPHCSPYCSLHAWSNIHKESTSYIPLLPAVFFFCLCNLSLYKWTVGRRGHCIWYSAHRRRFCLCVTACLDNDQGRILVNLWDLRGPSEFCVVLLFLEKTLEDRGVQVRYEQRCRW